MSRLNIQMFDTNKRSFKNVLELDSAELLKDLLHPFWPKTEWCRSTYRPSPDEKTLIINLYLVNTR